MARSPILLIPLLIRTLILLVVIPSGDKITGIRARLRKHHTVYRNTVHPLIFLYMQRNICHFPLDHQTFDTLDLTLCRLNFLLRFLGLRLNGPFVLLRQHDRYKHNKHHIKGIRDHIQ